MVILQAHHGGAVFRYVGRVPRFFPKPSLFHEPKDYVVDTKRFRREVVGALYFVWIVGILEFVEILIELHILPIFISIY
jgi:hypothetical protein